MSNREIILLGHKSGVGKDTLARLLAVRNYVQIAFADHLKSTVSKLYDLDYEQIYGVDKNRIDSRYKLTPRQILQKFGKEQREVESDIWARLLASRIETDLRYGQSRFVVSDFRFPNEYRYMKRWADLHNVHLFAYRIDREKDRDFAGSDDISEVALNDFSLWDGIIENNGTEEDLFNNFLLLKNFST